jgi:serine/threonine protein kinase
MVDLCWIHAGFGYARIYLSGAGEREAGGRALRPYSLGSMLYEMLSGKTPFSGPSSLGVMHDRLINHPLPPSVAKPTVSPQLQEVLYRTLERELKTAIHLPTTLQ